MSRSAPLTSSSGFSPRPISRYVETRLRPKTHDGLGPRLLVALERDRRLAGRPALADLLVEALDVDADRGRAGGVQPLDPDEVVGRLDLHLDREVRQDVLDGRDAAHEVARAAVGPVRGAGRHDELAHAVQAHRGERDLGDLLGALDLRRLARAQRLLDRAEATAAVRACSARTSARRSSRARSGRAGARSARRGCRRRSRGRRSAAAARRARAASTIEPSRMSAPSPPSVHGESGCSGSGRGRAVEHPVPSSLGPAPERRRSGGAARRPSTASSERRPRSTLEHPGRVDDRASAKRSTVSFDAAATASLGLLPP